MHEQIRNNFKICLFFLNRNSVFCIHFWKNTNLWSLFSAILTVNKSFILSILTSCRRNKSFAAFGKSSSIQNEKHAFLFKSFSKSHFYISNSKNVRIACSNVLIVFNNLYLIFSSSRQTQNKTIPYSIFTMTFFNFSMDYDLYNGTSDLSYWQNWQFICLNDLFTTYSPFKFYPIFFKIYFIISILFYEIYLS